MSDFEKIDANSAARTYGPVGVLISGASLEEQKVIAGLLSDWSDVPLRVARAEDVDATVGQLLRTGNTQWDESSAQLPRLVLMSGLTHEQFHTLMGRYRQAGLPRPLWASLTPYSEPWRLRELLRELEEERRELG